MDKIRVVRTGGEEEQVVRGDRDYSLRGEDGLGVISGNPTPRELPELSFSVGEDKDTRGIFPGPPALLSERGEHVSEGLRHAQSFAYHQGGWG